MWKTCETQLPENSLPKDFIKIVIGDLVSPITIFNEKFLPGFFQKAAFPLVSPFYKEMSWRAGSLMQMPSAEKRDPWQGQSHVLAEAFHSSEQPMCGQCRLTKCA